MNITWVPDPQTGRPLYETQDGKTTTDISKAGKFANFGTFMPKHLGGFNLDFRLGNFSVAAFFSYQFDVVRNNNIEKLGYKRHACLCLLQLINHEDF
jgi:hypothetical protein